MRFRATRAAALAVLMTSGCGTTPSATPTPSAGGPSLIRAVDRQNGFSMTYPSSWQRLTPDDSGIQLQLAADPHTFARVRVISYAAPADPASQKALIDAELAKVSIVDETSLSIHGAIGWQAVYGVQASSGLAVHIHVFLFEPGVRIHTVVFETPRTQLPTYARTFDLMRDSYEVLSLATPPARSPSPAAGSPPPTRR